MLSKHEPDSPCKCYNNRCEIRNEPIHQLACFHTFHLHCHYADGSCPICTEGARSMKGYPQAAYAQNHPHFHKSPSRDNVTCWHFFPGHSQSTILGRTASNGAFFIVLTLCRLFFCSWEIPDSDQPLSQSWIYRVIRAILIGNRLYDRISEGMPLTFDVPAAIEAMSSLLGGIKHSNTCKRR